MILSKCALFGAKNQDLLKQEAKRISSSLGLKTSLNKIPLLGNILFWMQFQWMQFYLRL